MKNLRKQKKVNYNIDSDDEYEDDDYEFESSEEDYESNDEIYDELARELGRKHKNKDNTKTKQEKIIDENDNKNEPKKYLKKKRKLSSNSDKENNMNSNNIPKQKKEDKLINKSEEIEKYEPYDVNKNYFYKTVSTKDWTSITTFIDESLINQNLTKTQLSKFFQQFENLKKGDSNPKKLLSMYILI